MYIQKQQDTERETNIVDFLRETVRQSVPKVFVGGIVKRGDFLSAEDAGILTMRKAGSMMLQKAFGIGLGPEALLACACSVIGFDEDEALEMGLSVGRDFLDDDLTRSFGDIQDRLILSLELCVDLKVNSLLDEAIDDDQLKAAYGARAERELSDSTKERTAEVWYEKTGEEA